MAFIEETDNNEIDRILLQSKKDNPNSTFSGLRSSFSDETFFLKDSRNDGILAWSIRGKGRPDAHWVGSWGSVEKGKGTNQIYDAAQSLAAVSEAFKIANRLWPGVPFVAIYSDRCDWVRQLVLNKGPLDRRGNLTHDLRAIDIAIKTIQDLGTPMIKLDPPQRLSVSTGANRTGIGEGRGSRDLGLVFCHSDPLTIDPRLK